MSTLPTPGEPLNDRYYYCMSALTSNSGEWQTPPWLVEKCRGTMRGISLDAATSADNPVGADRIITAEMDALNPATPWWRGPPDDYDTLFLNPPGEKTGKLIRRFWKRWSVESWRFRAAIWVDFNLDHLRFIEATDADRLLIPRKRLAFVDPLTGLARKGAQIGGFILCRGRCLELESWFPETEYLHLTGTGV